LSFALQNLPEAAIFPSCQDQVRNWQGKNSATVQRRLSFQEMIKMLSAAEFENASSRNRAEPVEIWKARKFIHEHSDEELSLTKVAKLVSISPTHLSDKFKEVTGVNFVHYIAQTRTEKARELLQDQHLRITEIAFAVGFQSVSQFNRVFKKLTRRSPSQFRAAHKKRTQGSLIAEKNRRIFP